MIDDYHNNHLSDDMNSDEDEENMDNDYYIEDYSNVNFYKYNINIEESMYIINMGILSDNNSIIIRCNIDNINLPNESIIYQIILDSTILSKYFSNKNTIEDYFCEIGHLIKTKKLSILYDEKLYDMKIILYAEEKLEFALNKKIKDISELNFKYNPNLKFKEDFCDTNCTSGCNNIFEVFLCYKDSNQYLITPNYKNFKLDIYDISNNKLVSSLEGHKNSIYSIKYFINSITNKEYLISSDAIFRVIVWNINKNYKISFSKIMNYHSFSYIYSCIIMNKDEYNYIIVSSYGISNKDDKNSEYTKMYSLLNGSFIKNIYLTNNNYTRYLIPWYNKKNNNHYVIECCDNKISINNLFQKEVYCELVSEKSDEEFFSGFLFNESQKEYLFTGSWNGFVRVWDLYLKTEISEVRCEYCELYHIIPWSKRYGIIADKFNNLFKVIDLKNLKIVSNIGGKHFKGIKCIKKIIHPKYGESLLTCSDDGCIKLYTT